ncbi:MAG: hypothetical protein IJH12_02525 [Clostridia bacterium]|nr:hypothetical protein [Clostridia bacterium]
MYRNISIKPHIVIDESRSKYVLLDANLTEIDVQTQMPVFSFITRKYKLKKFRLQLKKDLKKYKRKCRILKTKPDKGFLKMNKDIQFYLSICPDADYNILELLRRNITKVDTRYHNYQSACAEYLRELAKLYDGNPALLPFDINFATENNKLHSKHKYISNTFISKVGDVVENFKLICSKSKKEREQFIESHTYMPNTPYKNSKYFAEKYVYTPQDTAHDYR